MEPGLNLDISDLGRMSSFAETLLDFAEGKKIFLFYAPMGAGKTTFIKELCIQLGSVDNFSSPTYSIINEYHYPGGKIYHFDLYRLKNAEEVLDLGIEEYLHADNYCFIEWPGLAEIFIEGQYLKIEMEMNKNTRYLRATRMNK
jgi:tRNA threonylcarbamoyladenosine biosynthesis protein TsaE